MITIDRVEKIVREYIEGVSEQELRLEKGGKIRCTKEGVMGMLRIE